MNQSTVAGLAAVGLGLLAGLMVYLVSVPAAWIAGVGVVLVALGVFGGVRGPTGSGVGLLAVASLFATAGESLWPTLGMSAAMALFCLVVLLIADLSFAMRRDTVVGSSTLQGFFGVHAVAASLGLGLAVLLIAGVLAVSWPGWLLLLPGVVLGAASVVLVHQARSYNRKLRPTRAGAVPGVGYTPPPPPQGIRTTMPPPPAPGARPTRQVPPPPAA